MKKVILAAAVILSLAGCVTAPVYYTPVPVYATPVYYRNYIEIPAPVYYQAPQYYYIYR